MSNAGWHPDPGGAPGMFRYWDGSAWSSALSPNPYAPPPVPPAMPGAEIPAGPGASTGWGNGGAGTPGASAPSGSQPIQLGHGQGRAGSLRQPGGQYGQDRGTIREAGQAGFDPDAGYPTPPRAGRGIGWWVLIGVLVIGMIVGGYTLLRGAGIGPFGGTPPASNPTGDVCPKRNIDPSAQPTNPSHRTADGRIVGGKLSYPALGSPWGSPHPDDRVPFGRDTATQEVVTENNFDGRGSSWVASVLVGELVAGDGFFSPQQGSEIVSKCVLGVFYADADVNRRDVVNRATTVGGKDAWEVEMHLSFDIPGLREKGETAIIVIVATGAEASSIYYASIPDSRAELLQTARQVQKQLRVEP